MIDSKNYLDAHRAVVANYLQKVSCKKYGSKVFFKPYVASILRCFISVNTKTGFISERELQTFSKFQVSLKLVLIEQVKACA